MFLFIDTLTKAFGIQNEMRASRSKVMYCHGKKIATFLWLSQVKFTKWSCSSLNIITENTNNHAQSVFYLRFGKRQCFFKVHTDIERKHCKNNRILLICFRQKENDASLPFYSLNYTIDSIKQVIGHPMLLFHLHI